MTTQTTQTTQTSQDVDTMRSGTVTLALGVLVGAVALVAFIGLVVALG